MTASGYHAAAPPVARGADDAGAQGLFLGREWAECAALALLALAVFFFHLGSYGLWEPDEARYAEIAREMLATRSFLVPHLNYVAYIEKPPLLYWTSSLAFFAFGINEFAARTVPALSALAGVIATYYFARRAFDRRRAALAAAILIANPLYAIMAQVLTTDMLLTALLTVAFFSLFLQWREGGRWWIVSYLAMALAVLTKGPVGVMLPALAAILFAWHQGELRDAPARLHLAAGLILLLAVALPWFVIIAIRLPGFLDFYVIGEHFRRVFVANYSHNEPFYYYLPVIMVGLLPWSVGLPLILVEGTKGPARAFCAIVAGMVLVLFSAAHAKLIPYILPAIPPTAVLLADSILRAPENRAGSGRFVALLGPGLSVAGLVLIAIGAAAPLLHDPDITLLARVLALAGAILLIGGSASFAAFLRGHAAAGLWILVLAVAAGLLTATYGRIDLEARHSYAPMGRELAARAPGATLIDYRRYQQAITFYTRRRVILVSPFLSELRFGAEHSADRHQYFLDSYPALFGLWAGDPAAVLIIDDADFKPLARELGPIRIIAQQGHKLAIARMPESH
jgi:4-amino-4-deoxy-L-arabinose transferase-like glycosyltransferase